jgi:hypothetical protein
MKPFMAVPNPGCREAALGSVRMLRDSEKARSGFLLEVLRRFVAGR